MPNFIPQQGAASFPTNTFTFTLFYVNEMDRSIVCDVLTHLVGMYVRVLANSLVVDGVLQDVNRHRLILTTSDGQDVPFALGNVLRIGVLHPLLTPASCGGLLDDNS